MKRNLFISVLFLVAVLALAGCKVKPTPANSGETQSGSSDGTAKENAGAGNGAETNPKDATGMLPFRMVEAFSQKRISGVAGGISTTEYTFNMVITSADKLEFDTLWIDGYALKLYIAQKSKVQSGERTGVGVNDTLSVRATLPSGKPHVAVNPPEKITGIALISYSGNGLISYLNIDSIKRRPDILGQ